MTVATLRPDGWPQATTAGYVNEGLTLYFLCGLDIQKAKTLARDKADFANDWSRHRGSDDDHRPIDGSARACGGAEAGKVLRMLPRKYPEAPPLAVKMPSPDEIRLFRVTPTVISVLDYSKGFGHTDLVTCWSRYPRGLGHELTSGNFRAESV
jgi:hypothetical protein